jgi:hypothetical protein
MEDKLIVKGVHEEIDGEHPCDILGMLTIGHPESMTNRELHRIKKMTGILAGDLMDAINNSDMDASVALTAVILERKGKVFQDDWLWDAPMGAGLTFEIHKVKEEELPPQSDAPKSTPTGASETSGGVPSEPSSESPENDQSGTGSPPTDTSAT